MSEPIYDATAAASPATPESAGTVDMATVQRMIDQAVERSKAESADEIEALRTQLTTARAALPATLIPQHAGGVGVDTIAPTWGQYEQDLAQRGVHPDQQSELA